MFFWGLIVGLFVGINIGIIGCAIIAYSKTSNNDYVKTDASEDIDG